MKIEKKISLKVCIEDKDYTFLCEEAAPLGVIWDVLTEMRGIIFQKMKEEEEKSEKIQEKEKSSESD